MDLQTAKLVQAVKDNAMTIAKALKHGDVEIRKSANGISVAEVRKKVIAR